jgi:hypothetical protein
MPSLGYGSSGIELRWQLLQVVDDATNHGMLDADAAQVIGDFVAKSVELLRIDPGLMPRPRGSWTAGR